MPRGLKIVLILAGIFVGLRVFSALAIYGVRVYLNEAKASEGKNIVGAIGRGMVTCVANGGVESSLLAVGEPSKPTKALPPTAAPVPASVPKGLKYMSAPGDWSAPAFRCSRFALATPQYLQYEWELVSPLVGVVHAHGDLDGDGKIDVEISQEIRCTAEGVCTPGSLVTTNP
jgi:hypothetical protein